MPWRSVPEEQMDPMAEHLGASRDESYSAMIRAVGELVGCEVGSSVGALVGCEVGSSVGLLVGGAVVGASVGDLVGSSVSPTIHSHAWRSRLPKRFLLSPATSLLHAQSPGAKHVLLLSSEHRPIGPTGEVVGDAVVGALVGDRVGGASPRHSSVFLFHSQRPSEFLHALLSSDEQLWRLRSPRRSSSLRWAVGLAPESLDRPERRRWRMPLKSACTMPMPVEAACMLRKKAAGESFIFEDRSLNGLDSTIGTC
mmetsp:Transcript_24336/g.52159  ORF Transcript_24336/g.52159 Transcript_24336/m.52159 type:complete len:254 (-) Transcript_24336:1-762(-)